MLGAARTALFCPGAGVYSFEGREWEVVTEAAKDMITLMLVMDVTDRASAEQLLQHRWFQVCYVGCGDKCLAKIPGLDSDHVCS